MKILTSLGLIFAGILQVAAADINAFTKDADLFFKKYVNNGSVAYSKIKTNSKEIESLYQTLGEVSLANQNNNTKTAFFINAYNLVVIYSIVQNYPVESPMDIEGFFDKKEHKVAGENMTLNELEKEKLLSVFKDARFHFVLVCAAKSCPPLMSGAYTPEKIEMLLEQRTKYTINNNTWLVVDSKVKKAKVSKIFEWYNGDFTSEGKSLLDWINQYRNQKIPSDYKIEFYEYNWSLNN